MALLNRDCEGALSMAVLNRDCEGALYAWRF